MRTLEGKGTFEQAIASAPPAVQEIARELRALVDEVFPEAVEVPWPKQRIVGYGIGPKKLTEHFCYITAVSQHADLGFNHGAALSDPAGLLEGTGAQFRHVKIRTSDDVRRPEVQALLAESVAERRRALDGAR